MNSLIKQRAKERTFEQEKAERPQQMAEALMRADSGKAADVPRYALLPSNVPSRASSVLGASGHVTEDGDDNISERMHLGKNIFVIFENVI